MLVTSDGTGVEPAWYRDAVFYEVRVRSFADSDGDGVGDFRGLTDKLDYLQDLGVTTLWLLPFYPSPLRDDGYDISDYTSIHPSCGTLSDFRVFLKEAHRRGLRVVTELVLNHTSDQHPWFQRARRGTGRFRDFYVWNETPDKYADARIIFKDFEHSNWTWDPVAKSHYWHRFFSHQPDLNFENPDVKKALLQVLDFWLGMGVDGLRLDAIPYLFEREGTNCENLPETHTYLKQLRAHVDKKFKNRMLLAEANQWPDDAVAYFGKGDECHMAFHFPIMPRMFMAIHMEDRLPLVDILAQTPAIPENCQWALFLRNHDELTLEMVTDEERDYMYKVYATDPVARINLGIRRRLAPLLGNHRRKIELMNGLLFSLPGTPVIYYGDEIGMGDNIFLGDRNGVRTPMQWSSDKNAGFSRANPQRLLLPIVIDPEYHYESINVEAQQDNPHSLLRWMKRLISLRKHFKAFGRGTVEMLNPRNKKVLVFVRRFESETILVVANLSRFVQYVELDLSAFKGRRPVEMFGRIPFPPIGDLPYFITMGPHSFYWFAIEATPDPLALPAVRSAVDLRVAGEWEELVRGDQRDVLENVLTSYLPDRRWFASKSKAIRSARITDAVPFAFGTQRAYFTIVSVDFVEGQSEIYSIPIAMASGAKADQMRAAGPNAVIASVHGTRRGKEWAGVLYDASADPDFAAALLESVARGRTVKGELSSIRAFATPAFRRLKAKATDVAPHVLSAEQSNTSIRFGNAFVLKLYRKLDAGVNPDFEVGRYLSEETQFKNIAPLAGALEYRRGAAEPTTLGLLAQFVPNRGDAWKFTREELRTYIERLPLGQPPVATPVALVERSTQAVPEEIAKAAGDFVNLAYLLGKRTGEMHRALAASEDPAFLPEPFSPFSQRSVYQSLRALQQNVFLILNRSLPSLSKDVQALGERVSASESAVGAVFNSIRGQKIRAAQIRCHGDFHLGQVLYTGDDFIIIDFEGEPARSLSERRLKRSPLKDVAGMIRSLHYAAHAVVRETGGQGADHERRELWCERWYEWMAARFLAGYRDATKNASFLPSDPATFQFLLDVFLLEKAVYELGYELNNRPDWANIPMMGILRLLPEPISPK